MPVEVEDDGGARTVSIPVAEDCCRAVVSGSIQRAAVTVITLCGIKGGLAGPRVEGPEGNGFYDTLAATAEVALVQLEYRRAGSKNFAANIADARAAVDWVGANGAARVALVGHSQGGAVALQVAAQRSRLVVGVAALASQTKGVPPTSALRALVEDVGVRVLVVHGDADATLRPSCGRDIASRCGLGRRAEGARGSVNLEVLKGADHQFAGHGPVVASLVDAWALRLAGRTAAVAPRRTDTASPAAPAAYAAAKESRRTPRRYLQFVFVADEVLDAAGGGAHGVRDARAAVDALRRLVTNSGAAAAGNALEPESAAAADAARGAAADGLRAAGLDGEMRRRLRRDAPGRHALVHKVLDGLFVGGWAALNNDCEVLRRKGVTRVVSCVSAEVPRRLGAFVTHHLHVVCADDPGARLCEAFPAIVAFIETARAAGETCYVHCGAGVSRACTATASYVMWKGRMSAGDAMRIVKAARPQARPNPGFLRQLDAWAGALGDATLDDAAGLRGAKGGPTSVAVFACAPAPRPGGASGV